MRLLSSQRGNALVFVLLTLAVLSGFVAIGYDYTAGNGRISQRGYEVDSAYAIADGVTDVLYARWCAAMQMDSNGAEYSVNDLTTSPRQADLGDITRTADPANPGAYIGAYDLGLPANSGFTVDKITIAVKDVFGRRPTQGKAPDGNTPGNDNSYRPQPDPDVGDPTSAEYDATKLLYYASDPERANWRSLQIVYEVTVQVTSTMHGSVDFAGKVTGAPVTVRVSRMFRKRTLSTLQCVIFYENDMELFPGSDLTVTGLVHTNQDFYAGGIKDVSTLTFNNFVTYVGTQHDTAGDHALASYLSKASLNESLLNDPVFGNGVTPARADRMNIGGMDPKDFDSQYVTVNKNNDNGYRELIERPVLAPGATGDPASQNYSDYFAGDPSTIKSQRLYNQAGLKILIKPGNVLEVRRVTDTDSGKADGTLVATSDQLYKNIQKALTIDPTDAVHGSGFYDLREGTTPIDYNVLDMSKLKTAIESAFKNDTTSYNGIVYLSDVRTANSDGSSDYTSKPAFLVTNGEKLPQIYPNGDSSQTPLSFSLVTDNAVYVKGDYNTGGTGAAVPSNLNTATTNSSTYAKGYEPITSAIFADAVGVVSSNFQPWAGNAGLYDTFQSTDPAKLSTYLPDPADPRIGKLARGAVNTTVNTAVVAGNVESSTTTTGTQTSSGGAQNLFRQLENWTDDSGAQRRITYNGSLMQMFRSQVLTGSFDRKNFNNPIRDFRYDKTFLNHPPKGATRIYSYSRGTWVRS